MGNGLKLHGWDLLIVAAYFVVCLVIGLYRSTKIKTTRQFALGYHNISTTILVCIIFASNVGGGTLLGYAEKLSLFGLVFVVSKLFVPIGWLTAARIYSPNIMQFNDCISISQIMHKLYGFPGRWVTNIAAIIMNLGILVAQALAIGYIFHYFFGIEIIYGILISYGILTLYTALGGVRAVVITEIFQFSIFFFIIPVSYVITLTDIGGVQNLMSELPALNRGFEFTTENVALLISFIFFTIIPECHPPIIQRCLMATSAMQLKKALKTVSLVSLPFVLSVCLIAYIVMVHSPDVPANEAFVFYISNYLPVGLKGLMVAGVIAAIMGLAEAWLNASSVILVNDVVKILYPKLSNTKQLLALRVSVVCLSVASVTIASFSSNVIEVIWLVENFWTPLILIPLSVGFLGFRTSGKSFITSVIMALIFTMVGRIMTGGFATVSLSLGIIGSAIGLFGMHYWQILPTATGNTALQDNQLYKQVLKVKGVISIFDTFIYLFFKQVKSMISLKEAPYQRFATFTLAYYFLYTFSLN